MIDVELLTPVLPNSSSVDIDLLTVKGKGPKCETPWRVFIVSPADYEFNEGWRALLLRIGQ